MEDKHRYDINLRQGDLRISLSSDDVYFISKQMDKWFKVLLDDSYVPITIQPGLGGVTQAPKAVRIPEVVPTPPPVQEVAPPPPAPVPVAEPVPQPAPVVVEAPPPPPPPAPVEVQMEIPAPAPQPVAPPPVQESAPPPPAPEPVQQAPELPLEEVLQAAVHQPAEFVRPSAPQAEEVAPQPVPEPVAQAPAQPEKVLADTVEDDFEAVMDSLMKDLGEPVEEAPAMQMPFSMDEPVEEAPEESFVEEYAFPSGMQSNGGNGHSREKVDFEMINSLSELCDKSRAATSEDYLLLSAFYITYFEGLEKFSLKRINSMLVKSGLTPVNHSVLETALTHGHLSMVQDMTGMAEATEYTMTDNGMDAAHHLL